MECAVALTLFICRCTSNILWKKHSYKDNFLNGESEEKLMDGDFFFTSHLEYFFAHWGMYLFQQKQSSKEIIQVFLKAKIEREFHKKPKMEMDWGTST